MKKTKSQEPSFEEALAGLEGIVTAMERGDVPLADLVAKYEQASALLARCKACLGQAEMTVERLRVSGGVVATEPFAPGEESPDGGLD